MSKNFSYIILAFIILSVQTSFSKVFFRFNIPVLNNPAPGYIFTGAVNDDYLTLYDNSGQVAISKDLGPDMVNFMNLSVLSNGNISFYGSSVKKWFIADSSFNLIDSVQCTGNLKTDYHDFKMSPDGHYLIFGLRDTVVNMQVRLQGGKANAVVVDNVIQEFDRNGNVTFQWSAINHINVLDATSDVDLTSDYFEPYHINAFCYDNDGNILVAFRHLDAIVKINKSNGNIIWTMGGSSSRNNQFTFYNDTRDNFTGFSHQHDIKLLDNGNILMFDNGNLKPTQYSRAVEYQINESAKTATRVWECRNSPEVFTAAMGSVQRLPNGNTFIGWVECNMVGKDLVATEVTSDGTKVFEMRQTAFGLYRVYRYPYKMDVISLNISSNGDYLFGDMNTLTGITLNVSSLTGGGNTSVEKHYYAPYNLSYVTQSACTYLPYRWVINNLGISRIAGKIAIILDGLDIPGNKEDLKIYCRTNENTGPFRILSTSYNSSSNKLEADITSLGEFFIGYTYLISPTLTYPENNISEIPLNPYFRWTSNSSSDLYQLQVSKSISFDSLDFNVNNINGTQINNLNLKSFTKYYWRVKSTNSSCESLWTVAESFTTIIGTPLLSSPIDESTDQPNKGELNWKQVTGADAYRVQISLNPDFTVNFADETIDTTTSYKYNSLKAVTQYFWRVTAGNNKKFGDWSETWSFITSIGTVSLFLPQNLLKGVPAQGLLNWNSLNGANYYRVEVSKDSAFLNIVLKDSNLQKNEYKYAGLENSQNYFWRVKASSFTSVGNWSDIWTFKTVLGFPNLASPTNNLINVPVNGLLNWNKVFEAVSYQVQVSKDNAFSDIVLDKNTDTLFLPYTKLDFNKQFYWRVRATDSKYFSDWSEIYSFKTQPDNILLSPVLNTPENNSYKVPLNTSLKWRESVNATGYDLQIADDMLFKINNRLFTDIKTLELPFKALEFNKKYYWQVMAKNTNLTSDWSEVYSFTTKLKPPFLINPIDNQDKVSKTIEFSWDNTDNLNLYHIQIALDSNFNNINFEKDSLNQNKYQDTNLINNKTYYWRVSAFNSVNESDWSEKNSFTTEPILSIEDLIINESSLLIWPNPAKNLINVKVPDGLQGIQNIFIYDVTGVLFRTINFSGENNVILNCTDFQPGFYLMEIRTGKSAFSYKLNIFK